jgi:hypothetical protein
MMDQMSPASLGMKAALAAALAITSAYAQDAREIVRRSVRADNRNDRLARNYTYKVLNVTQNLDSAGRVKATHSTVDEVLYIGGRQYLHPLEKDGKPLPSDEAKKEQAKFDRAAAEASRLSDAGRRKREEEEERSRAKRRERVQYIPDAFDFSLLGETPLNGRDAWQIRAAPRRDYKGPYAFLLRNLEGTIWIDKRDYQWVKVEADTLGTISIGLFLARIGKGTRLSFENFRVNGEIWAAKHISLRASARVGLIKRLNADQELTFSDYRKFQTDSRVVSAEAEQK